MGEREDGGEKHILHMLESRPFPVVYCVLSRGAPPTPQNSPKGPPFSCIHKNIPRGSLCIHPPAHAVNPGIPTLHPGCNLHCPFPPPHICTLLKFIGHFPFQPPPSKRERDVQHVQVKGGGEGLIRLIPVCFR